MRRLLVDLFDGGLLLLERFDRCGLTFLEGHPAREIAFRLRLVVLQEGEIQKGERVPDVRKAFDVDFAVLVNVQDEADFGLRDID
jgi:hypothetical protein